MCNVRFCLFVYVGGEGGGGSCLEFVHIMFSDIAGENILIVQLCNSQNFVFKWHTPFFLPSFDPQFGTRLTVEER